MTDESSTNQDSRRSQQALTRMAGFILFAFVFIAFAPAVLNNFLTYDDPEYVTNNPYVKNGLALAGIKWAFAAHGANWHPVTWLSHLLDGQIFGMQPWGHHLTNVLLHALNALLAFVLLKKMTGSTWPSFFAALFFGLHPLRVESVAWVAERKDVLSVFFFLLALITYARYVESQRTKTRRAAIEYALTFFLFILGLLSKSMLVTFPIVLLLLDFWPLERFRDTRIAKLALEKIPFFALTGVMCVIARQAQHNGAAMVSTMAFQSRIENALVSWCRYLSKIFWPTNLSPFYPRAQNWPMLIVLGAALFLIFVSIFVIACRKRWPWCFVGWFWFLGTLVPVIGFIQIGEQAIADRYTYIPSLGIMIAVMWSAKEWIAKVRAREMIALTAAGVAMACCFFVTLMQVRCWRTTETLFTRAVQATPDSTMACIGLAACLSERGEYAKAIPLFQHAAELSPGYYEAHYNLGLALAAEGRIDEAVAQYQLALKTYPTSADCHLNLGAAFARQGHLDEAIAETQRAGELNSSSALAQQNLAHLLIQKGRTNDAIAHFHAAIQCDPRNADFHNDLGGILAQSGQLDAAIQEFKAALDLDPRDSKAVRNLALAQRMKGKALP